MRYTWGYILNPFESWSGCRMRQPASKAGYRALSALHQCFLICTKCLWNLRHWLQPLKPRTCLFEILNWDLPGPLSQWHNCSWEPPRNMKKGFLGLTRKKVLAGQHVLHDSSFTFGTSFCLSAHVHALREFYENHPVIHNIYLSYGKIELVIPKRVTVGVTYFTLFCSGFFKVLAGISLA